MPARHHHRDRDDAGDQAAEKGDDEFEAGRKHQQRALAGPGDAAEPRRERVRGIMQLAKAEDRFLGAAIGQEDVGAFVGLAFRPPGEQFDQRGERFHIGQNGCRPQVQAAAARLLARYRDNSSIVG